MTFRLSQPSTSLERGSEAATREGACPQTPYPYPGSSSAAT
jgi:hypothetical protein